MRSFFKIILISQIFESFGFLRKVKNGIFKKILMLFFAILALPAAIWKAYIKFTLPYLEVMITSRCSLNCESCSNFIPLYGKKVDSDFQKVKKRLEILFQTAKIHELKLIGGEPFLHPELHKFVRFCLDSNKIKKLTITTNGVVFPDFKNIKCLKDNRVKVLISKYSGVNQNRFIETLKKNGIKYNLIEFIHWQDYGGADKRGYSNEKLIDTYSKCEAANCKTLYDDKIYSCPRSAHGDWLGFFKENIFIEVKSNKEFKKSIKNFYRQMRRTSASRR